MEKYYIIRRENNDNVPLLAWDESARPFRRTAPITRADPVKLRVGDPIPARIEPSDMYWLSRPVIGGDIAKELEKFNIDGMQLLPCIINGIDTEGEYYLMHFYKSQTSNVDFDKSVVELDEFGDIKRLERIAMAEKFYDEVNVEDRLGFKIVADFVHHVFHESVKSAIENLKPSGIEFIPLEDWNVSSPFGG